MNEWFQSTHPLRDATKLKKLKRGADDISIHAPLTGCDLQHQKKQRERLRFQSTHPLRDATRFTVSCVVLHLYFNPRTPYGMRRSRQIRRGKVIWFQSTHPLRDATLEIPFVCVSYIISIHAPLTGCDSFKKSQIMKAMEISIHAPLTGCDIGIHWY